MFIKKAGLGFFLLSILTSCASLSFRTTEKALLTQFESRKWERQHTGFLVVDAIKKDTLFNLNGNKYFIPASTTKLFTFYTCLKLLGDRLPSLKYVYKDSTLYVEGTGAPTFLNPNLSDSTALQFLQQFDSIALNLDNYQGAKFGPGWAWEDYHYSFSPEIGAFPIHRNVVEVLKGDSLIISPSYFKSTFSIADEKPHRKVHRNDFFLSEGLSDTLQIPFVTSDTLTAKLLAKTLGSAVVLTYQKLDEQKEILYGMPTDSVVKQMLWESDNFTAEQLMLTTSSTLSDTLSFATAKDFVLDTYLTDLENPPRWVDGSGLSRYNLFTPKSMITVLSKLFAETDSTKLFSLMPRWNADGTIEKPWEMTNNPFIYAKSGSMGNVYNLCGYLKTQNGRLLFFSFMNNHFRGPSKDIRQDIYNTLRLIHEGY